MSEREFAKKLKILYFFFVIMFILLIIRYIQIQIFTDKSYFQKLLQKYPDKGYIKIGGYRGTIYTSDGVPLAISLKSYIFFVITDKLTEKQKKLASEYFHSVFRLGKETFLRKLNQHPHYWKIIETTEKEYLEKFLKVRRKIKREIWHLTKEVFGRGTWNYKKIKEAYEKIGKGPIEKAYNLYALLNWIGFHTGYRRYYPQEEFFANTIGTVYFNNNTGRKGIELMMDKYLYKGPIKIYYYRGTRGFKPIERPLDIKEFQVSMVADVYLTVDFTVQAILERVKKEILQRWKPKEVVLILMDIHTGAIKGLAVYPEFNPNRPFRNWQEFLNSANPAFMHTFEMGSVLKPFFVGMALYKGRIKEDSLIYIDHGKTKVGRYIVRDAEILPKQYLTPLEVLIHSSNVGVVEIARKLKKEDEEEIIKLLKWDKKISNFPGSTAGIIPNLDYPANRLFIAFGHGLALTPIHLVSSYCALITGYAPKPYLVEKIVREDGKILYEKKQTEYLNEQPFLDENTRQWIKKALRYIVLEGTGKKANSYYYAVGGKTGTAEVYDIETKQYSKKKYITSFIGVFPYPNPKYVLLVLVAEPKSPWRSLLYGGSVAAPYFREIVNEVAPYLGLRPLFSHKDSNYDINH